MSTVFSTLRGATTDPLPCELITWQGERLGKIGMIQSIEFVQTIKPGAADTATLKVYLDDLTATLLACDGEVLITAWLNGIRLLYVPITAEVASLDDDPRVAVLTVQAAGAWSFIEGEVTTPGLDGSLSDSPNAQFEITSDLETAVKTVIGAGIRRVGHPLVVLPTSGRGPTVTITGAWETVGEHVADALKGTGYGLTFTAWVPGDPPPAEGLGLSVPCYIVDVRAYTPRQGLIWSTLGRDIGSWRVERKRASATRAIAHNGEDDPATRMAFTVQGDEPRSLWGKRETYVSFKPRDDENNDPLRQREDVHRAAVSKLTESAPALSVSADVHVASGWEYGTDGGTPRQFTVGDIGTLDLPVLGEISQVITDVTVTLTPTEFTITPSVGTPDTLDTTAFGTLAALDKRLTRLERKG